MFGLELCENSLHVSVENEYVVLSLNSV